MTLSNRKSSSLTPASLSPTSTMTIDFVTSSGLMSTRSRSLTPAIFTLSPSRSESVMTVSSGLSQLSEFQYMDTSIPEAEQTKVYGLQDNDEIFALRSKALIGKTVQGTLITTIRKSGKKTFWVRWNKRKCDCVLVRPSLVHN